MTPEKARDAAGKILARVELGEDPGRLRSEARQGGSLADLLDAYLNEHIKPKRKQHTKQTFTSYINVHIRPALGDRTANTITSVDISKLHRTVGEKHPVTANRLLVLIHAAYAYAAKARLLPADFPNPSEGIEKFRESGRERYLTEAELLRLGDTLRLAETEGLPWEPNPKKKIKHAPKLENRRVRFDAHAIGAIRLLLLTGCRLREILHLKWNELDLNRGLLFLPDSKTGKKTIVLGAPAMVVLSELPRLSECVIASPDPKKPRSDLNRPWKAVSRHAGLAGVRLHDLRHSFASTGAGEGLGLPVIGRLLGHANPATTQRYAHLADGPMRRAADVISEAISAALDGRRAVQSRLEKVDAA